MLKCDGLPDVEIHFLHYNDFDGAKNKWIERCKRINYENIFVVIEAQSDYEKEMIPSYAAIPYEKIIFSDSYYEFDCCKKMKFYQNIGKGENFPILKLISPFGRRGYDEYDFVENIFRRKK